MVIAPSTFVDALYKMRCSMLGKINRWAPFSSFTVWVAPYFHFIEKYSSTQQHVAILKPSGTLSYSKDE